jgi:hypothetical protein
MRKNKVFKKTGEAVEVFYSSKRKPPALYEYVDSDISGLVPKKKNEARPWYNWGANNLFPNDIFKHVYLNDIKPELIKQSVDLICGNGVFTYREIIDPTTKKKTIELVDDPQINDFFYRNRIDTFFRERVHNLELYGNAFAELIPDGNNKIQWIKNKPACDVRAEYIDPSFGRILNYYLCGDWRFAIYDQSQTGGGTVDKISSFFRYDEARYDKYIHHSKYYLPGQDYYSFPIWYFGTKAWAELSTEISSFQLANLQNGMSLRFHVKIPKTYFDQFPEEKREAKKAEIQDALDDMLAGSENASKTFFSFIDTIGGSQVQGWDIIPINFDSKDDTFLNTFDVSSRANSRGHGIHPTLSGIDIKGNLGSGSEILNLYNYHVGVKAVGQRDVALEIFYDISERNGWDRSIKFGVEYVQMTTVDKNPTGKQNVA